MGGWYGVAMSYTTEVRRYLSAKEEAGQVEIIRFIRRQEGGTYHQAQSALYAMVKAGQVGWNRKMGNAGRYHLLPSDSATAQPPLGGGRGQRDGMVDGGDEEVVTEGDVWQSVDSAHGRCDGLRDAHLLWLADRGYLMLNRKGRAWYQGEDE